MNTCNLSDGHITVSIHNDL
uniref:Uncharacterized protein n=1 Tax=Arundo donax TaxID=35708 RepID=A0A0A9PE30_ARUDO